MLVFVQFSLKEIFEYTKEVIRNHKLKKDRKFNGMLKTKDSTIAKGKRINNDLPKYYTENIRLRNTNQTKIGVEQ